MTKPLTQYGNVLMSWQIPEYEKHERSKKWYFFAFLIAAGFLILSLWTPNFAFERQNFLFAIIIVLISFIIIVFGSREPDMIYFIIATEGIVIGNVFYDFDSLDAFAIIYKPQYNTKGLYFEFKNKLRPRLSIPIDEANPIKLRDILSKYLQEDLERINEPNSDFLGKYLKI